MKNCFTKIMMLIFTLTCFTGKAFAEEKPRTSIQGFVDTSYGGVINDKAMNFIVNEFEIDFISKLSNRVDVRADLQFAPRRVLFGKIPNEEAVLILENVIDSILEQAFVSYLISKTGQFKLTVGKFNSFMDSEKLDYNERMFSKRALAAEYGTPDNHVGMKLSFEPTDETELSFFVHQGWNREGNDNNLSKSIGGRIEMDLDDDLVFGISSLYGPEQAIGLSDYPRFTYNLDLVFTGIDKIDLGFTFNSGTEDSKKTKESVAITRRWTASYLSFNYSATEKYKIGLRGEFFDDRKAGLMKFVLDTTEGIENIKIYGATLSNRVLLDDNAFVSLEYNLLSANEKAFRKPDGSLGGKNQYSILLQFNAGFKANFLNP